MLCRRKSFRLTERRVVCNPTGSERRMKTDHILRMARMTRPIWRYKTPVLYRVSKWVVTSLCPKGKPGNSRQLIAPFDGGLIQIDTSSSIEYHLLFRGCHESAVTDIILRSVKAGDTCIDVGANVGAHALVMAKMAGPYGRVIALEPHPQLCARLRQNVELNRFESVQVVESALSDKDGESSFYGFDNQAFEQGISSLLPDDEATQEMKVQTETLQQISHKAGGQPDFRTSYESEQAAKNRSSLGL